MSVLTFADLRHVSEAHLHQHAPNGDTRAPGAWSLPPPTFGDRTTAPLPKPLLDTLARLPVANSRPGRLESRPEAQLMRHTDYEDLVADCHESVEKILDALRELEHATQTLRERAQRARNLITVIQNEIPE